MAPLSCIEIVQKLRVVACATCGETYAVPLARFLASKRDRTLIYCPAGHPWQPLAGDADHSNDLQAHLELAAELADTRAKLDAARRRLEELTPADEVPPGKDERRRRSRILAARAESPRGDSGRAVCCFCGGTKARGSLAEHLRRQHAVALAEKPAAFFDVT